VILKLKKHTAMYFLAILIILPVVSQQAEAVSAKHRRFRTSDHVLLHYIEAGRGSTMIFIPGWTMPAKIWEKQFDYFARRNHVIFFDPRSQGLSEKVGAGHYPERMALDIRELIQHLKVQKVTLIGWSLGVSELLTYVDLFGTDSISALILVDGYIERGPPDQDWLQNIQMRRDKWTARFVRDMYKTDQSLSYYDKITNAALSTPTDAAAMLLINFTGNWWPVIPKINCPLLFIATPKIKEQALLLKQRLASAQVEIFENTGHAVFVDDATRFNSVVNDFLQRTKK